MHLIEKDILNNKLLNRKRVSRLKSAQMLAFVKHMKLIVGSDTGWHEPVLNPERVINNSNGYPSLRSGAFGAVRSVSTGIKNHGGVDIFSPIGTPIYACLDGEVISAGYRGKTKKSGYGNTVMIKVNKENLDACRNDYELEFTDPFNNGTGGEVEKGPGFGESDNRYLLYAHLDTMSVNKGDKVIAGQQIGTGGKTGLAETVKTPKNRHLHFEILSSSSTSGYYDLKNRENAAFYVNFKKPNKKTQESNKD